MDKKSVILGILFIGLGFAWMLHNSAREAEARRAAQEQQIAERERLLQEEALRDAVPPSELPEWHGEHFGRQPSPDRQAEDATVDARVPTEPVESVERPEEEIIVLQSEHLRVFISTHGGSIRYVDLLKYPEENPRTVPGSDPVRLNQHARIPALSLSKTRGTAYQPLASYYEVIDRSERYVTLLGMASDGLEVRRTYELLTGDSGPEPYTIRHQTELRNVGSSARSLERVYFNLGVAAPSEADHLGFNLNASLLDNSKYRSISASQFRGGGFIISRSAKEYVERRGMVQWGAVNNQFFTAILTPRDRFANALIASGVPFPEDSRNGRIPVGVTASMEFNPSTIPAGSMERFEFDFYTGPKDFQRLSRMALKQEDVMQLGWFLGMFLGIFSFVAKSLLFLMTGIYGFLGNWGFAIILTTIIIRLLLWPLTAKAARASKRMQKLSKPLQDLREKYKDNPQKLNEEMMALWKKHKINPLAGCWPVMVQIPIFIAFFNMLRNSSDLRFAPFLWIQDLSMPDGTISFGDSYLPLIGNTLNLLPFVWLVSMHFQMKMMPQPSIDNAQVKIIRWMPYIFFPFTYFFSSGLVLYWTSTNCFSIFQQWMTNRTRDEEDVAIEAELEEREDKKKGVPSGPLIRKKKKKKKTDEGGMR